MIHAYLQRTIIGNLPANWYYFTLEECATQKLGFGNFVVWSVLASVLSALGKGPEGRSRPAG